MSRTDDIRAEVPKRSECVRKASRGLLKRYGRLLVVLLMVLASASFAILLIPEHRLEIVEAASLPGDAALILSDDRGSGGLMCPNPTATPTRRPKSTPTVAPTATLERTPTLEPTVEPTPTLEPTPTSEPTVEPTPTLEPTLEPTVEPTPTLEPSVEPTPILEPTVEPTPTQEPTVGPTPTNLPPRKPASGPDRRGQIDVSPSQPSPSPTVDIALVFLLPETGRQGSESSNRADILALGGALTLLVCGMLCAMERRIR
jgi:outer membrane biosynthesis protein TonB